MTDAINTLSMPTLSGSVPGGHLSLNNTTCFRKLEFLVYTKFVIALSRQPQREQSKRRTHWYAIEQIFSRASFRSIAELMEAERSEPFIGSTTTLCILYGLC